MATKSENIIRLNELSIILGRPVDETGTAADIEQRVKEWEEEAAAINNSDDDSETGTGDLKISSPGGMVLVKFIKTVHLFGAKDESGNDVLIPVAGSRGYVPAGDVDTLKGAGLLTVLDE